MVKNMLFALIENADRINCMTLFPWALDFINSSDAQFETSSSSKIQTLKLFYKYDTVTHSIGLVLYDDCLNDSRFGVALCHQMLKKALKLNKVHSFGGLSMSQFVEKIDLMTEIVLFNQLNSTRSRSKILITIISLARYGVLAESDSGHKEYYHKNVVQEIPVSYDSS